MVKKKKNLLIWTLIGGLVALVILMNYVFLEKREVKTAAVSNHFSRSPAEQRIWTRTLSAYLCPCGSCGEVLLDCTCQTAGQIKETVNRRLIREGLTYDDLTEILEKRYRAIRIS